MTLQNRKDVRSDLASKITTAITDLQAVYGYYPKSLGGESPVCTIENLPVRINLQTSVNLQNYDFAVTFWAMTDGEAGSGLTAEDAENKLDDLHYALCLVLKANYNAEFFQPSDMLKMEIESGKVYQVETHYVRINRP